MQAGKLRHRIELQSWTEKRNDYGEITKIWATYVRVWASIEPLRGTEALIAQQVSAELSHKVRIRYNSSVTAKDRIKFGTRIFSINSARNIDEKNIEQELLCKEVVA